MAQLLLDAFTAEISRIDTSTVYVQSILDENSSVNTELPIENNEDDLFQCGKCKKQFNSLTLFLSHKKEHCPANNSNGYLIRTATQNGDGSNTHKIVTSTRNTNNPQQLQIPSSPMCIFSNGSLLTEADLLSFATFDNISSGNPVSSSYSQSSQTEASINSNDKNQSIENLALLSPNNGQNSCNNALGLSILGNALMSSPYLLTNQTNDTVTLNPSQSNNSDLNASKTDNMNMIDSNSNKTSPEASNFQNLNPNQNPSASSKENVVVSSKSDKMSCHYCGKYFTKNFDLQQHIRSHTGEKPFQCIVCGRAFAQKSNVKKHLQTHKVWPDGLANTLPKKSNETDSSKENDQSSNDATKLKDDNASISTEIENSYACPYCAFRGASYFLLKSHMKHHKVQKVYKCVLSICAKMFNDLDSFLEHVKTHEKEMTYFCHLCNKSFDSLYNLGVHQYTHSLFPPSSHKATGGRPYRCTRCRNRYSTTMALEHHMATSSHHYPCPHCRKAFPCERYLRRHLLTHGVANLHVCPTCEKGFKTEHYLKIHMSIHSGEKPYVCNQCGAAFNRVDKLKRHKLCHDPVKRHKCPFQNVGCQKEFSRPDKLKAHILTHSNSKRAPYQCHICDKSFTLKFLLRVHQRTHEIGELEGTRVSGHIEGASDLERTRENGSLEGTLQNSDLEDSKCVSLHCTKCRIIFIDENRFKKHTCVNFKTTNNTRNRYLRSGRVLKSRAVRTSSETIISNTVHGRRKGRPRKHVHLATVPVNLSQQPITIASGIENDIPTAHIEIITTNMDENLSEMSIINPQYISILPNVNSLELNQTISIIKTNS